MTGDIPRRSGRGGIAARAEVHLQGPLTLGNSSDVLHTRAPFPIRPKRKTKTAAPAVRGGPRIANAVAAINCGEANQNDGRTRAERNFHKGRETTITRGLSEGHVRSFSELM